MSVRDRQRSSTALLLATDAMSTRSHVAVLPRRLGARAARPPAARRRSATRSAGTRHLEMAPARTSGCRTTSRAWGNRPRGAAKPTSSSPRASSTRGRCRAHSRRRRTARSANRCCGSPGGGVGGRRGESMSCSNSTTPPSPAHLTQAGTRRVPQQLLGREERRLAELADLAEVAGPHECLEEEHHVRARRRPEPL